MAYGASPPQCPGGSVRENIAFTQRRTVVAYTPPRRATTVVRHRRDNMPRY